MLTAKQIGEIQRKYEEKTEYKELDSGQKIETKIVKPKKRKMSEEEIESIKP